MGWQLFRADPKSGGSRTGRRQLARLGAELAHIIGFLFGIGLNFWLAPDADVLQWDMIIDAWVWVPTSVCQGLAQPLTVAITSSSRTYSGCLLRFKRRYSLKRRCCSIHIEIETINKIRNKFGTHTKGCADSSGRWH